jgi:hypothetical protein
MLTIEDVGPTPACLDSHRGSERDGWWSGALGKREFVAVNWMKLVVASDCVALSRHTDWKGERSS